MADEFWQIPSGQFQSGDIGDVCRRPPCCPEISMEFQKASNSSLIELRSGLHKSRTIPGDRGLRFHKSLFQHIQSPRSTLHRHRDKVGNDLGSRFKRSAVIPTFFSKMNAASCLTETTCGVFSWTSLVVNLVVKSVVKILDSN
jgi:hypothetical protein